MKKIIGISILSLIFFISPVWGLDIDTEYAFLGDEIFIVLETIGDNEMAVIDGGVLVNEQWYYFDIEDIKITRITEDAEQGKVFGHTENNHNFYILWNVDGDWNIDNRCKNRIQEANVISKYRTFRRKK